MPANKSKIIFPAIGAAAFVVGGLVAYLYLKGSFSNASNPIASAKVVPDEALMATFISTDSQPWLQLQQFGTPEAQKLVKKSWQDFTQQALAESNIDYEKDLKPWVGSVMIAVLPSNSVKAVQQTSSAREKSNLLMVVGIKDKVSALNFANKLKAEKAIKSQEINYKGQKIAATIAEGKPMYSAVLDDRLVLAPERHAVEQAIDTFKGEPSFATKAGAENILTQSLNLKNLIAQVYLPNYANAVQQLMATNPDAVKLPPATLAQLQQVKSIVAGIGVDEAGLRMKAIAQVDPNTIKVQYQPTPGKIVAQFPADTFALVSGQGISRNWSAIVAQSKTNSAFQQGLEQARQQLKTFNLDLDLDIFGWMDGEFALAAIPSNQGLLAPLGFGAALVLDTSDRATAEATFNKLDAIAKNNLITVTPREIQGKSITEWQIPFQGAFIGHGWLDHDTAFVAVGSSLVDAIATKPSQSLDNSATFTAVTGSLAKPNAGYFYLDMDKTMSLVATKPLNAAITPEASTIFNSIRGIGITASSPDKSISQVELLLALKPQKK